MIIEVILALGSMPCTVDGPTFYKFEPNSFNKPSNSSQTYHFDPDLWDTYSHTIHKESQCKAVQEMQDEMDKYDIPLDDRYEYCTAVLWAFYASSPLEG